MQEKSLVIADGHHRYETALALRDSLRQQRDGVGDSAPYEYVMTYCTNIADPGLVALPTHRLLRHIPTARLEQAWQRLGDWVQVEPLSPPAEAVQLRRWQRHLETILRTRQREGSAFVFYAGSDRCWLVVVPAAAARQRVRQPGVSVAWKCLDVSVLHYALLPALQALLAVAQPLVAYAKADEDVFTAVASGEYDLGVLMNPTPLEQLMIVAKGGERMPHKSTYFYPKLPTGLVIYSFDL